MHSLRLFLLPEVFAICRFSARTPIPQWALASRLFSVTSTPEELSVVCNAEIVPPDIAHEGPWRAFRLQGPIPFTQTGVLASILNPLAESRIGIFALSTFDTDYVLVSAKDTENAVAALRTAGHEIIEFHRTA